MAYAARAVIMINLHMFPGITILMSVTEIIPLWCSVSYKFSYSRIPCLHSTKKHATNLLKKNKYFYGLKNMVWKKNIWGRDENFEKNPGRDGPGPKLRGTTRDGDRRSNLRPGTEKTRPRLSLGLIKNSETYINFRKGNQILR